MKTSLTPGTAKQILWTAALLPYCPSLCHTAKTRWDDTPVSLSLLECQGVHCWPRRSCHSVCVSVYVGWGGWDFCRGLAGFSLMLHRNRLLFLGGRGTPAEKGQVQGLALGLVYPLSLYCNVFFLTRCIENIPFTHSTFTSTPDMKSFLYLLLLFVLDLTLKK